MEAFGQEERGEKLRSADLDMKNASETADESPSYHSRLNGSEKMNENQKSDRGYHRRKILVSHSSDPESLACSRKLVTIRKADQRVLTELHGSIGKLQTLVAGMRADNEERRLRPSSEDSSVYTDIDRDTMDRRLRSLEIELAMSRRKLDASKGNPVKVLKIRFSFENHENEYRLIRTIHSNVELKAQFVKRTRGRRLEEEALFSRKEDDKVVDNPEVRHFANFWIVDHLCWPYRALYRWIFDSLAKEQTAR